jgi:hypothetical protein
MKFCYDNINCAKQIIFLIFKSATSSKNEDEKVYIILFVVNKVIPYFRHLIQLEKFEYFKFMEI